MVGRLGGVLRWWFGAADSVVGADGGLLRCRRVGSRVEFEEKCVALCVWKGGSGCLEVSRVTVRPVTAMDHANLGMTRLRKVSMDEGI